MMLDHNDKALHERCLGMKNKVMILEEQIDDVKKELARLEEAKQDVRTEREITQLTEILHHARKQRIDLLYEIDGIVMRLYPEDAPEREPKPIEFDADEIINEKLFAYKFPTTENSYRSYRGKR